MGTLYIVATPIGNLGDITLRALDVLRQVSLIAAEDTRTTRKLLSHYGICTPLVSYYEHNRLQREERVLSTLADADVALASESGTPTISDPGYQLVRSVLQHGHRVSPVPGPNAAIAAVAASGMPTDAFTFVGFLPRQRNQRQERLGELAWLRHTLVFYESPRRVPACLADMLAVLGNRRCAVARELTKIHEEIWRGSLEEAVESFGRGPRGEFTLVIEGRTEQPWPRDQVEEALHRLRQEGWSPADAARQVAVLSGWPRAEVYRLGLDTREGQAVEELE